MARPREFDEHVVLARARDAFWAGGAAGTSISDVCEATGLASGSIYKAWGSKTALHHATLEDYLTTAITSITTAFRDTPSPLAGIEEWLDSAARAAGGENGPAGCYAVRCAVDTAEDDAWVRERLARHDRALHDELTAAVARAVAGGELEVVDPPAFARLLLVLVNGIQVEARKGITTAAARAVLTTALRQPV